MEQKENIFNAVGFLGGLFVGLYGMFRFVLLPFSRQKAYLQAIKEIDPIKIKGLETGSLEFVNLLFSRIILAYCPPRVKRKMVSARIKKVCQGYDEGVERISQEIGTI